MRYATFAIITQQILVSTRPAQTVADPWHLLPLHVPLPAEHFMCPPAVRIKAVADSALRCAGFSLLRVQQQCCESYKCRCPSDLTAAPEGFAFAALAGECLRSCSAATALDVNVLLT